MKIRFRGDDPPKGQEGLGGRVWGISGVGGTVWGSIIVSGYIGKYKHIFEFCNIWEIFSLSRIAHLLPTSE